MHRKMIELVVQEGTTIQMREMQEWVVKLVDCLKKDNFAAYIEAEKDLHTILGGSHLGEPLALNWVAKMKNKDGSCGQHGTIEQTTQIIKDKSLPYDKGDWYATLNMVYSDYFSARYDTNNYIELAKDWLSDSDVSENKLLNYYYYVVCGK